VRGTDSKELGNRDETMLQIAEGGYKEICKKETGHEKKQNKRKEEKTMRKIWVKGTENE
jgi:hypothetical protein